MNHWKNDQIKMLNKVKTPDKWQPSFFFSHQLLKLPLCKQENKTKHWKLQNELNSRKRKWDDYEQKLEMKNYFPLAIYWYSHGKQKIFLPPQNIYIPLPKNYKFTSLEW